MKKVGRTLLLILLIVIVVLFLRQKKLLATIEVKDMMIDEQAYNTDHLIDNLDEIDAQIISLRKEKFTICEVFGNDLPVSQIERCGLPK